jgi:RNA 2',3'-cyclic 3'-phosphodiesterase
VVVGRVFLAVPLPGEIALAIGDRLAGVPGRVVPSSNLHLTLRFLGQVDQLGYERFLGALYQAHLGASFGVSLGDWGAFPNPRRATVLWLAVVEGVDRLGELAEVAEEAALRAGLGAEERPFQPHLTVSRIRPPADLTGTGLSGRGIRWRCREVVMYRSHLVRGGARYEPLDVFPLSR